MLGGKVWCLDNKKEEVERGVEPRLRDLKSPVLTVTPFYLLPVSSFSCTICSYPYRLFLEERWRYECIEVEGKYKKVRRQTANA